MMLSAVTPVAQLYLRTTIGRDRRALRVAGFLSGYLLVWTAAGLTAFGMAWGAQRLATDRAEASRLAAAGTFLAVAAYQVSPLKDVCLKAADHRWGCCCDTRLPRWTSRPSGRRPPRAVLPGLLLGVVRCAHRAGNDQPPGDGASCAADS
jgi:predicted metal-binding membrane protein